MAITKRPPLKGGGSGAKGGNIYVFVCVCECVFVVVVFVCFFVVFRMLRKTQFTACFEDPSCATCSK